MGFSTGVNNIRRWVMERITKRVGSSSIKTNRDLNNNIKKVLIVRPNHKLGNQLLLTPIVQEVINTFPECKIDLFVKGGITPIVFKNYTQIDKIISLPRKPFNEIFKYIKVWASIKIKHYDLVINGDKDSSSGRILTYISNASHKIFGDVHEDTKSRHSDFLHISKYPIYNLRRYLEEIKFKNIQTKMPLLDIKLSDQEIAEGKLILDNIIKNNKKTICIYTNATRDKCYSEEWWETFYARLVKKYSNEYNIIEVLPVENISKIAFKAPTFYSEDVREMGAVIHNTSIFIAADNGIMHLASASQTPTIGFFSVTNPEIYEPYGNSSLALDTTNTNIGNWFDKLNTILN